MDLDRRAPDKTNGSSLILGNTGQGKSYLLKLLLCNVREVGKNVIALDSEHELEDLCGHLGGCFLDLLSGQYRINLLEPRRWDDGSEPEDPDAPPAFRGTLLAQHISFLRDIFRVYKGFDTPHIDTLELMIERLYQQWGISDETDLSQFGAMNYPVMTDLYDLIERTYQHYDQESLPLYPPEMLRDLLLGLHSMCKGADFRFFNGHTNISSDRFLVFCVKGLDDVAENLRNTLLFNVLSYMSDRLLTAGNTVATIDELYLWLSNPVAITYIRNALKRVRKRGSSMVLASQNLEDFDQPGVRELTRPLFAIPTHQFLFNAGTIDKRFYMDLLQLEPEEYELIRQSQRGICLYKCGNERYLLEVHAPSYKCVASALSILMWDHISSPSFSAICSAVRPAAFAFSMTDRMVTGWRIFCFCASKALISSFFFAIFASINAMRSSAVRAAIQGTSFQKYDVTMINDRLWLVNQLLSNCCLHTSAAAQRFQERGWIQEPKGV